MYVKHKNRESYKVFILFLDLSQKAHYEKRKNEEGSQKHIEIISKKEEVEGHAEVMENFQDFTSWKFSM